MAKKPNWKGPPPPTRGNRSPWPFKTWKVGDTKRYPVDNYTKIRNAVDNLNRKKDGHWLYAKVLENGKEWVRVWRDE